MHVLSISALKGGVGKTTITLGLASAAMSKGLRTLVIDLDPSGNASSGLGAVGEFEHSAAEVLRNPRHNAVLKAIVAASWAKGQTGRLDVMASNPRLNNLNTPRPRFKTLWNLEIGLAKIEADYDLVLIDTPPNINALTRMAWVASDRVLLVTEPALNSVYSMDFAIKALADIRKQINRNVGLLGIVVNRLRPSLPEHQFRINELEDIFGDLLVAPAFEEKSAIQQATGSGRSIHSWPGQAGAKIAAQYDSLLEEALQSFASEDLRKIEGSRRSKTKNKLSRRTHDVSGIRIERAISSSDKSSPIEAPRVELVDTEPVSAEFQDQWQDILRQTMTEKQIKALTQKDVDED